MSGCPMCRHWNESTEMEQCPRCLSRDFLERSQDPIVVQLEIMNHLLSHIVRLMSPPVDGSAWQAELESGEPPMRLGIVCLKCREHGIGPNHNCSVCSLCGLSKQDCDCEALI